MSSDKATAQTADKATQTSELEEEVITMAAIVIDESEEEDEAFALACWRDFVVHIIATAD